MEKVRKCKDELVFDFTKRIYPYDIYIRGENSQIPFKNMKDTIYESKGIKYIARVFESSITVYEDMLQFTYAWKNDIVQKFMNELLDIGWIKERTQER